MNEEYSWHYFRYKPNVINGDYPGLDYHNRVRVPGHWESKTERAIYAGFGNPAGIKMEDINETESYVRVTYR